MTGMGLGMLIIVNPRLSARAANHVFVVSDQGKSGEAVFNGQHSWSVRWKVSAIMTGKVTLPAPASIVM